MSERPLPSARPAVRTTFLRAGLSRCTAAVLAASIGLTPAIAFAQPAPAASGESASDHFGHGVGFYKDGDFAAAMVEFKRAYEIEPSYPVLYNIGQTLRELRDYAAAQTAFQKYLAEGAKASDQSHLNAHKDKVQGYLEELKPKIATLTINVTAPGADISVDDVSVGTSPLDKPLAVNAGRRKISASKSGFIPVQKFIDVGGTDQKSVDLDVVAVGGGDNGHQNGGGDTTPVKPTPSGGTPIAAAVAVACITGAAGIATIGLGVKSLSAKSDFENALAQFPGNSTNIESTRSTAKSFALGADITGGVTAAGIVTTIILFATLKKSDASKPDTTKPDTATILPLIGPGSVGLAGTF